MSPILPKFNGSQHCGGGHTMNPSGMSFTSDIRVQGAREEVILTMMEIMMKNLKKFATNNGCYPKQIFVYRDGVSEGMFDEIHAKEYMPMKRACEAVITNGPQPKITFVIVKKRHHTRFQPQNKRDAIGGLRVCNDNMKPGVVVCSNDMIHPKEKEFYINSHVGIQGTSKPTRYHVIHDDNNCTMEELTEFTYQLCYGFVRCQQPVSYPSATYYAHLIAYRARNFLGRSTSNADGVQQQLKVFETLPEKYPMFFV